MAFKIDYVKRAASILDLSKDEVSEWAYRTQGHLNKHGCYVNEIIRSVFILQEIRDRREYFRKVSIPDFNMSNKTLLESKVAIANLVDEGYSANRIFEALHFTHKDISLATLKRFIKAYRTYKAEEV